LDVTGRIVMIGEISSSQQTISLENFEAGNFVIRMVNNENTYTVKVVKL
jgi:hypothetical protein